MQPNLKKDTGWIQCAPASSDIQLVDWSPLQYRKINEIVYICGAVKITNPTWDKTISQLPYEFPAEADTICRTSNANNKLSICAMSAAGRLAFLETAVDTTNTDTAPIVFINMAVPVK